MEKPQREMIPDRFTRRMLCLIAGLLAAIAVGVWQDAPDALPRAEAQIPDTGAQRQRMIEAMNKTNQLLSYVLEHLRTKPVKVQVAGTDERRGDESNRSGASKKRRR